MEENIHELLKPVVPGEPYHEKWMIGAVEAPGGDEAKVVFLLADGGTGREIRLEMTARDGTKECCEHSRSFNFAFSSKGRKSPAPGEETAVAMVIHAI
ncbi:MAG: hypothetical protein ABIH66_13560, partial [bacterium]